MDPMDSIDPRQEEDDVVAAGVKINPSSCSIRLLADIRRQGRFRFANKAVDLEGGLTHEKGLSFSFFATPFSHADATLYDKRVIHPLHCNHAYACQLLLIYQLLSQCFGRFYIYILHQKYIKTFMLC